MIVLISDLHLADSAERSTIDTSRLLHYLKSSIAQAQKSKVKELTLVLLGDIFEILKSALWLEPTPVRPWEICDDRHRDTVAGIVKRIICANEVFFETLRSLTETYDFLRLEYLPGNHDRPLNTEMGGKARELLREALPLQGSGQEPFREYLLDKKHRLLAHHGHEWDPANRYKQGLVAVGDAVVIQFVLKLPSLVRKKLKVEENDPRLDFLYEIDNIRPHTPKLIVQWVDACQAEIVKSHPDFAQVVDQAVDEVWSEFKLLTQTVPFETYVTAKRRMSFLTNVLGRLNKKIKYRRLARLMPNENEEAASPYYEFASRDLRLARDRGDDLLYLVCGHTHHPQIIPLNREQAAGSSPRFYFNTGTWRRVRREATGSLQGKRAATFSCWQEECVVNIYNQEDQQLGFPPYEFYRITRGVQSAL